MASVNFADVITFTRASGGGRFNAQGQYEWLPANEPRIDYDPVTGECRGLLVEESRTNLLTDSGFAGQVIGAALPLNWSYETRYGLSTEVVGTGTENGIGYVDLRVFGTGEAGGSLILRRSYGYAVAAGSAWSFSAFAKIVSSVKGPNSVYISLVETGVWSGTESPVDIGTSRFARYSVARTAGGDRSFQPRFRFGHTAGVAYDYVVRIGGTQLEAGSFPTSYIPTTTAQVTRAADMASVNDLSPWYNASEGTLFVNAYTQNTGVRVSATLSDGTIQNRIQISTLPIGTGAAVVVGNVVQAELGRAFGKKVAFAFSANDFRFCSGGGAVVADTSGALPPITQIRLGAYPSGSSNLNGHIQSLEYYPRRLSNTELQEITA